MKSYRIAALIGVGLLLQTTTAAAWLQWYQLPIPFGPPMWFYQDVPQAPATEVAPGFSFYQGFPTGGVPGFSFYQSAAPAPGQMQPWYWHQQSVPGGAVSGWSFSGPTSGFFIEQSQSPAGYNIRIHTGKQGAQDVDVRIEGGALIISRHSAAGAGGAPMQMQQGGWTTQLITLAADANVAGMRVARRVDGVDIFIPRGG